MRSKLFYSGEYQRIEKKIKQLLNSQPEFMSARTVSSTRATGDAIQEVLAGNFRALLGRACKEYSADFARRAMADLAFKDADNLYYVVDVKTHRKEDGFHMPNLTSVERLARFYEDDMNCFVILAVSYRIKGNSVTAEGAVAQIGTALNEGGYSRKIMCFFTVAAVDDRGIPVKSAQFGFGQRAQKISILFR